SDDNLLLSVDLMNPDTEDAEGRPIPHGTLHAHRTIFLQSGVSYERLELTNSGDQVTEIDLVLDYAGDFVDLFEVRGTRRAQRGELTAPELAGDHVVLAYRGLDGVQRKTRLDFDRAPFALTDREVRFRLRLPAKSSETLRLSVSLSS